MTALEVADWRRNVFALYAAVRAASDPAIGHELWRTGRDRLFSAHSATPLPPDDRGVFVGLPVAPYDPAWRFELEILETEPEHLDFETGTDGVVPFERLGRVEVPEVGSLDVWRLTSYGGGIFLPVKDALAGRLALGGPASSGLASGDEAPAEGSDETPGETSGENDGAEDAREAAGIPDAGAGSISGTYGGGRYLLDTIKGADLGPGRQPESLVIDFNFAYNPSCAYDPAWACPLAQDGNTVPVEIPVGELYSGAY
jgi:uncharacterized protein (DUF1684 family)